MQRKLSTEKPAYARTVSIFHQLMFVCTSVPINKSTNPDARNTHSAEKEAKFMIPVHDQIMNDPLRRISERRPPILRLSLVVEEHARWISSATIFAGLIARLARRGKRR